MDFDELHSRFGHGGSLTPEGTLAVARRMNRNRQIHHKLALLLESHHADAISGIVEVLHGQVSCRATRRPEEPFEAVNGID